MANGHGKVCSVCKVDKPLESFGTHLRPDRIAGKRYVNSRCRECVSATTDPAKVRDARLRLRYGISSEQFDAMLAAQGGCAICGRTTSNGKYWHVDHDHRCCATDASSCGKCIRGVLCHGCNTALGNVSDNKHTLRKMIAYLEKHGG